MFTNFKDALFRRHGPNLGLYSSIMSKSQRRLLHCSLVSLNDDSNENKNESTAPPPKWLESSENSPKWLQARSENGFEEIDYLKNVDAYMQTPDDQDDEVNAAEADDGKKKQNYMMPDINKMYLADQYPGEYLDKYSIDVLNRRRGRGLISTFSDEFHAMGNDISELGWIPNEWVHQYLFKGYGLYRMSKRWMQHLPNPTLPDLTKIDQSKRKNKIESWDSEVVNNRKDVIFSPLGHCEADLGRIYEIETEEYKSIFPEGFCGGLTDIVKEIHRRRIMIRQPALEIINQLRHCKSNATDNVQSIHESKSVILDGVTGVGKSTVLNHVVHYARKAGFLTLFIPNSREWIQEGYDWFPSLVYEGMYEQPEFALQLLKSFIKAHASTLASIPRRGNYPDKYVGNPFHPDLRKAYKTREKFILGELEKQESIRLQEIEKKSTNYAENADKSDAALEAMLKEIEKRRTQDEKDKVFDLESYENDKKMAIQGFKARQESNKAAVVDEDDVDDLVETQEELALEDQIALKKFEEWDRQGDEGTLLHMLEWGIVAPAQCVQTVAHLREELAQVTEVPVLIAIDGINHLYRMSDYFDGKMRLPASKLVLPSVFQEFGREGIRESENLKLNNGLVIATTDSSPYLPKRKYTRKEIRSSPVNPFEVTVALQEKHVKTVYPYSDRETEAALMNYFDSELIRFHVNKPMVQQIRMVNDANARQIDNYVFNNYLSFEGNAENVCEDMVFSDEKDGQTTPQRSHHSLKD